MNCIFIKNPNSGFIREHSNQFCICNLNPRQRVVYHVYLEFWCGEVCTYCKDRLVAKHFGAEVKLLPPWKLPPWKRPPRPPQPGLALLLEDDDEN